MPAVNYASEYHRLRAKCTKLEDQLNGSRTLGTMVAEWQLLHAVTQTLREWQFVPELIEHFADELCKCNVALDREAFIRACHTPISPPR